MKRYYGKDEVSGEKNVLLWVSPGSIRYNREDVEFLLPWYYEMTEGVYPREPSSYTGAKVSGTTKAYYEIVCQIASEIGNRLARCHYDRFLVEQSYCVLWNEGRSWDEVIEELAAMVFKPTKEIRRRINSAVSYISSGECPRWLDCIDCPRYDRCSNSKRPPEKFKTPVGRSYADWKGRRYKKVALRQKRY